MRIRMAALALALGLGSLTSVPAPASSEPTDPATPEATAQAAYDRMSPQERVGQLFMAGVTSTGATASELAQVRDAHAGNLFLHGHNHIGVGATAAVVTRASTEVAGVRPFVAADQEGGRVQALRGPGFRRMPTALAQGELRPSRLTRRAREWGRQLRAAGVNLDLGPVADVVPERVGEKNLPIGRSHREYGHRAKPVARHVTAFVRGMAAAGVATSLKHYPGLGRATGHTDTSAGVTDPTGPGSRYLLPFRRGISAGAPVVMVSSARYPRIDPDRRACFSPVVMRDLLRGRHEFGGIVISDSFASGGVADLPAGERAVRFFDAGGTLVLDTDPGDLAPMTQAVLDRSASDPAFAATVRQAVLTVLVVKARAGLVG